MLVDALDALHERDPRCDATIKELRERELLEEAVETCIEAAKFERESKAQIKLFRAAAYGSRFLEEDEQRDQLDTISDVCRDIRVVNLLGGMSRRNGNKSHANNVAASEDTGKSKPTSKNEVGMSLTYAQYSALSPLTVMHRLALWSLHAIISPHFC